MSTAAADLASRRGIDMPSAQGKGHPTPAQRRAARASLNRLLARRRDQWQEAVARAEAEREAVRRALTA